jgi:hypothetical protein
MSNVSETREIIVALLDDNEGKNSKIRTDDTASDGFTFSLTGTTGTVA